MNKALLWVDIETTGLDPDKDEILEVAFLFTSFKLDILADAHFYTEWSDHLVYIREWSEFIRNMHTESGLIADYDSWLASEYAEILNNDELDDILAIWLNNLVKLYEIDTVHFAGSNVQFDMSFLKKAYPHLFGMMHYRSLDVSSFKIFGEMVGQVFVDEKIEPVHRARNDIKSTLNFFRNNIFAPSSLV